MKKKDMEQKDMEQKDMEQKNTKKKTKVWQDIIIFCAAAILIILPGNIPDAIYNTMPEALIVVLEVLQVVAIFFLISSSVQVLYKLLVHSAVKATDVEKGGLYHDIAKPTPEFIEADQQVPVHESLLDEMVTPSLVGQPKANFSVIFQPEADKCTFLLSNGYSCTAEAEMVSENNYYIKWHTLSWNAPLSDRLSKDDKKAVALAFTEVNKDKIVWPFTDKKVNILQTRFSYY